MSFSFCTKAQHIDLLELDGFKKAVKSTDYLAKVTIIRVDVFQEADDSQNYVFTADVVTTFKGDSYNQISFEMLVEKGEDMTFNSAPVYLVLCKSLSGTYYWPGTGSYFKSGPAIDTWVNNNRGTIQIAGTFSDWCN